MQQKVYHYNGKAIGVVPGLGHDCWIVASLSADGKYCHRVKSPNLPAVPFRDAAQRQLDEWARKGGGLKEIEPGTEEYADFARIWDEEEQRGDAAPAEENEPGTIVIEITSKEHTEPYRARAAHSNVSATCTGSEEGAADAVARKYWPGREHSLKRLKGRRFLATLLAEGKTDQARALALGDLVIYQVEGMPAERPAVVDEVLETGWIVDDAGELRVVPRSTGTIRKREAAAPAAQDGAAAQSPAREDSVSPDLTDGREAPAPADVAAAAGAGDGRLVGSPEGRSPSGGVAGAEPQTPSPSGPAAAAALVPAGGAPALPVLQDLWSLPLPADRGGLEARIAADQQLQALGRLDIGRCLDQARKTLFSGRDKGVERWGRGRTDLDRRGFFRTMRAGWVANLLPDEVKASGTVDVEKLDLVGALGDVQQIKAFLGRVNLARTSRDELRQKIKLWKVDPDKVLPEETGTLPEKAKAHRDPLAGVLRAVAAVADLAEDDDQVQQLLDRVNPMQFARAGFGALNVSLSVFRRDGATPEQVDALRKLHTQLGEDLRALGHEA